MSGGPDLRVVFRGVWDGESAPESGGFGRAEIRGGQRIVWNRVGEEEGKQGFGIAVELAGLGLEEREKGGGW